MRVSTLLPGFTPEQLVVEGWVQKESRLLREWRARWLVLYRDHVTQLPVLCTFKEARRDWDWAAMPEPTERVDLIGCSCGIQADPTSAGSLDSALAFSLSLRSLTSSGSKAAPTHVFTVSSQSTTFAFATESADESQRWVGEISRGIAEAAMEACRRGGMPCVLPPQTPTAQTLIAPTTLDIYTKGAGAGAGAAHGATMLLERRNAQLEEQVQQLQGALGAMLLGELAVELEELGAREDELRRQLDEAAGAVGEEVPGEEEAGEEAGGAVAGAGQADDAVASEARELTAHSSLEAELASVASQSTLVRQRMEVLSQPTVTEATHEGLSPSYRPFGTLADVSQPRVTANATPGCDLDAGTICDESGHKETDEYVPFAASGLAPTDPLLSGSEPWQVVVAEDAVVAGSRVQQQAVAFRQVFAHNVEAIESEDPARDRCFTPECRET